MELLELVGLVLGYLGSIMLGTGILRSKQEVIDEERPFHGPNPFKMRSILNSRLLGFAGMSSLITGFAITTVVYAFTNILESDDVWLALVITALLLAIAYSIIVTSLKAKLRAHINAKNRYYFNKLIDEARILNDEPIQKDSESYDFTSVKNRYLSHLSHFNDDLSFEDKQSLGRLIDALQSAEDIAEVKAILDAFVSGQAKHPTQMPKNS